MDKQQIKHWLWYALFTILASIHLTIGTDTIVKGYWDIGLISYLFASICVIVFTFLFIRDSQYKGSGTDGNKLK